MKTIGLAYLGLLITTAPLFAQEPQWDWIRALHTPDEERATAVASDPVTGEVYMAGEWLGTLAGVFPDGTTESTDFAATFGGVDGLVAKFDQLGNLIWAFKVGGEGNDKIADIHMDESGHFYICGTVDNGNSSFAGTGPPDATTEFVNPGNSKAYLAKYSPDGRLVWVRFAGELELSEGLGIATNQEGVYMTGYHRGIISFGVLPPYSALGGTDLFVVKYSIDGDEMWHVSAGSDKDDYGEGIVCDNTHLYVCGRFNGAALETIDESGGVITATVNTADGQDDGFVASFTADGFHEWTRIIASAEADDCAGIGLDTDHVYVAGTIGQEAIFPLYASNPVVNKGGVDGFLCALGRTDGSTRWVKTVAGDAGGDEVVKHLSMDRAQRLYLTGSFSTDLSTADALYDSKGQEDVFLASYTNMGDEIWFKTGGGPGPDMGNGICAGSDRVIYCAGEYTDDAAFGADLLPADGSQNIFLARLRLDCMDALGGILSASDTVIAEGEVITLVLKDYSGDIRWEISLPGMNNWALLTDDFRDSIQVFPSGTADYRAFVTSGDCAPDSSNVIRVEMVNATISFAYAGEDVTICPGDSVNLKASGGDFYKWYPPDGLDTSDVADPWAKPPLTTNYIVHVTRADGLTDTDTVTVFVLPRPKVEAGLDLEACQGEQVHLMADGDGSLVWFPRDLFIDPTLRDPVVSLDTTTSFRVVVTDVNGCRGVDWITVFITPPPVVYAGNDQRLTAQFETWLEATLEPGESGTWKVESGNGVFEDPHAPDTKVLELDMGENIFSWTVTNGICPEAEDRVKIIVEEFLIPTVITPNGDGKNDYFHVRGIEGFRNSELVVVNRWGEEVYRASPYPNNWNGVDQNGQELPEDTYYIVLRITDDEVKKGYVVIIR